MSRQAFIMTTDKLDDVAVVVAQKKAMERGPVFLPHGTRLFPVHKGWESQIVSRDQNITSCDTLLTLEDAFKDSDVKVIFIPLMAQIDDAGLERIAQRNGVSKTIFREVEETV